MTHREEKHVAAGAIRAASAQGLHRSFISLLRSHIAEAHEALEEAQGADLHKLQGRVQLAREILKSITP